MTATKGDLRRAALLEAAEQVLVSSGNANATMRNFADAANVRLGHLQHYFPTRSDLMKALLDRILQRSLSWMREATGIELDGHSDVPITREESGRIVASLMAHQNDPTTSRLYVEIWAIAASDDDIKTVLQDFYRQYTQHVQRIIQRARPTMAPDVQVAKANAIIAIFEGAAIAGASFAGLLSPRTEEELSDTIQHLIHGP